jgi:hypothetical protein
MKSHLLDCQVPAVRPALHDLGHRDQYTQVLRGGPHLQVHCPKRLVNFVNENYGRWAPAISNEVVRN